MKEKLRKVREPLAITNKAASVRNTVLIGIFGLAMGFIAKWLDGLPYGSDIWWRKLIDRLDLGNVLSCLPVWILIALIISVYSFTPLKAAVNTFVFFAGMCLAYHVYTIFFCGFDPGSYMMIWYGLTLVSPLLAVICWYGKGPTLVSSAISALIFAFLTQGCFSVGWLYFGLTSAVNTVIFIAAAVVMYRTTKQIVSGIAAGAVLALLMSRFVNLGAY
ncbi:MAG: hypothetical protein IKW96_03140 [Ruminococcus sp.]|uniref:hypothetical protein n=1 Tax=Ruminococcus sp. TaxID=41978 RepID=UPI0025CC4088|nr:hypothetical protein [Ruminococcus sp.]MBR5682266.1 hypothetical protein [Ruminococcus sp.]